MRTFAAVAITGATSILLFKLMVTMFIPMLGLFLGLMAMTVKFALVAGVLFFIYSMIKKRQEEKSA